ncbi:recombinase family protein [Phenylobacterium sp.]|jgi:DNA invertase Pin-like site-specific DNA recombinase|uniref:recombinase family protein n=1 Tax=Phenylobacterium sp. TaxID=1871053 RepID=UPI002F3F561E
MIENRFVAYYRVSTERQGRSGLGLEAQREAVQSYVAQRGGDVLGEFTEVETGKRSDRPELAAALDACRRQKATLVIAKLDRLARNMAFVANLMEGRADFVAVDMANADRFTIHIFAALAEEEGRRISQRTKAALAAAKARGVQLGRTGVILARYNHEAALARASDLAESIRMLRQGGACTYRAVALGLNALGVPSARGGRWHAGSVQRVCKRLESVERCQLEV